MRYLFTLLIPLISFPLSARGVDVIEEVEPNDSLHTAQLLEEEVVVVGGVTGSDAESRCARSVDWYDVYAVPFNGVGTLELVINRTSGTGLLELDIFSSRLEPAASLYFNYLDSTDTLRVGCVDADTLYVRVGSMYPMECADYWLSWKGLDAPVMEDNLEPDDRIADAHRVPFGELLRGRVGYGRDVGTPDLIDYYLLTDVPDGDITFYFQGDTFSSVRLDMFGPFPDVRLGGVADSATFECVGGIDSLLFGISTSGRCLSYTLRVGATPSPAGTVVPDVEPNSSMATAIQESFPLDLQGRIGEIRFDIGVQRDSVDIYRVEMGEGDTMRGYIRFDDLTSGRLVLRDAAGESILSWSQQGLQNQSDTIPIELFAVEPGPMFIAVESGDDDCGFYEGSFSISGTSSVDAPDDPDRPLLSVHGGVMGLQGVDAGAGVTVELYDVRGEKVAECGGDDLRSLDLPVGIYLYRILSNGELIAEGRVGN